MNSHDTISGTHMVPFDPVVRILGRVVQHLWKEFVDNA
jgi:hypothetical protein